jgi:hypothetical protein
MMIQLGRIFTSLRDGISQPGDFFEADTPAPAAQEAAGATQAKPGARGASAAVKEKLQARKQPAPTPEAPQKSAPPQPSDALKDVVNFARAAQTAEDVERAATIALQITDADEAKLAQEHLDAAKLRIAT